MDILNQSIRRRKTIEDSHLLQPSPSPQPSPDAVHMFARTPSPHDFDSPASSPTPLVRSRPLSPLLPHNTLSRHRIHFPRSSKPWLSSIVTQFSIMLWLVPIAILLWLNLSSFRVGAALWCPKKNCKFNPFSEESHKQANEWNKEARNLIGILQLVAKVLEVWFVAIASGFIFSLTSFLVVRRTGLPLSLFLASVEFSDVRILTSKDFWLSVRPPRQSHMHTKVRKDWVGFAFIALLALLCIVTNLMGPAVAVLCVPRLQRGYTETVKEQLFIKMSSDQEPYPDLNLWPQCSAAAFERGDYTCTRREHASVFETWLATHDEIDDQAGTTTQFVSVMGPTPTTTPEPGEQDFAFNSRLFDVSEEDYVAYIFSGTLGGAGTLWAPNRHVLSEISEDFEQFHALTNNNKTLDRLYASVQSNESASTNASQQSPHPRTSKEKAELSNSLRTVLNRRGPAVGANVSFYHFRDFNWIEIEDEKSVLCMQGHIIVSNETMSNKPTSSEAISNETMSTGTNRTAGTKCLALGSKWDGGSKMSEAFDHWIIAGNETQDTNALRIGMVFASQARYLEEAEHAQSVCLKPTKRRTRGRPGCDYDAELNVSRDFGENSTLLPGPLSNVYTIFFNMNQMGDPTEPTSPDFVAIEFNPAVAMVKYSIDTSPFSNNARLVQLDDMPPVLHDEVATPIRIHHSWLANLFSARRKDNGRGYIAGVSNAPNSILNNLRIIRDGDSTLQGFVRKRDVGGLMMHKRDSIPLENYANFFHAAHLLPLHLMSMLPFKTTNLTGSEINNHPNLISRNATIEVWMYRLDSRTSYMGVTVVLTGSLVAIASFYINLCKPVNNRGSTSLLASALIHVPEKDELLEIGNDEEGVGMIRYHSDFRNGGWVKFEKVD